MSNLNDVQARIAERMPALPEKYDVPGVAWAVLADGAVVDGAAGLLSRATEVEATPDKQVVQLSDIQTDALLLELRDLAAARSEQPTGPLGRLMEYDREHRAHLVDTLRAWLDAFGDVALASERLYVHPNTFRYRLRRVTEVGQVDLRDPRQRFAVMLQLAVLGD